MATKILKSGNYNSYLYIDYTFTANTTDRTWNVTTSMKFYAGTQNMGSWGNYGTTKLGDVTVSTGLPYTAMGNTATIIETGPSYSGDYDDAGTAPSVSIDWSWGVNSSYGGYEKPSGTVTISGNSIGEKKLTIYYDFWNSGASISSSTYKFGDYNRICLKSDNSQYANIISYSSNYTPKAPSVFGVSKTGYTFGGYKTSGGTTVYAGTSYSAQTLGGGNTYTYLSGGTWNINYAKAIWNANGGSVGSNYQLNTYGWIQNSSGSTIETKGNYNSTITTPTASTYGLAKTGYTLTGWQIKSNVSSGSVLGTLCTPGKAYNSNLFFKYNDSTINVNSATNFQSYVYAQWTPNTYTIAFNANGGSGAMSNITMTFDAVNSTAITNNFTRTGYTFAGWSITGMTDDVTHYRGGNSSVGTSFTGTSYAGPSTSKYFKNLRSSSGTVTFTAQWTANKIKLTLNPNGGSGGTQNIWYYYGTSIFYSNEACTTTITKITRPTRTGYTFVHYYGDGTSGGTNGERYIAYDGIEFASDLATDIYKNATLYAQWTVNIVNITYYRNGGTIGSTDYEDNGYGHIRRKSDNNIYFHVLNYTSTDTDPYNASTFGLTKTGYKFNQWKVRSSGKILNQDEQQAITNYAHYDNKDKTAANTSTVYCYLDAQWIPNTYTVTFNANGGVLPSDLTSLITTYDSSNYWSWGTLANTTRLGFSLKGYYDAASGGNKIYNADGTCYAGGVYWDSNNKWKYLGNVTAYAQWEPWGVVKIYTDKGWQLAVPYIYDNGWKQTFPYIYDNGWKECH